jgi:hypothetical protein
MRGENKDAELAAAAAAADAKRVAKADYDAREAERVAARAPAVARARSMLGLASIVLAVANLASSRGQRTTSARARRTP